MNLILSPLQKAGINGIRTSTGKGDIHRIHPIFAVHASDYPEQLLVTCVKFLGCPKCKAQGDGLGDASAELEFRDLGRILHALAMVDTDSMEEFAQTCQEERIKPVIHPFWENLPYVNVYRSITPDLLHQLYQGVIKHVFCWVISIHGASEIDARCQRFPPNHHIRIFSKGISSLSRITGQEHNQMCRFLMGLLMGTPSRLPDSQSAAQVIRAVRALLDFTYIASYPRQSTHTLCRLTESLNQLHNNLPVFIKLGIRKNMNLPKLHALRHYVRTIELFGTTDNFNTEYTERLHIDLAKDAYRSTNHKDEFIQMTTWLERKEKILQHQGFLEQQTPLVRLATKTRPALPALNPLRVLKMAKFPSATSVSFEAVETRYSARFFQAALARYVVLLSEPNIRLASCLEERASRLRFRFNKVSVYHKIRFLDSDSNSTLDSIHVQPQSVKNIRGRENQTSPARFDVALIYIGPGDVNDIQSEYNDCIYIVRG